jgi:hypothetical protein
MEHYLNGFSPEYRKIREKEIAEHANKEWEEKCEQERIWKKYELEEIRKAKVMEQCKQKAISNIELEKRKQANLNKKETPEQYKARTESQVQKVVKKETPAEYKARTESQAQKVVKKETPEEYKARKELQVQREVKK